MKPSEIVLIGTAKNLLELVQRDDVPEQVKRSMIALAWNTLNTTIKAPTDDPEEARAEPDVV